MLDESDDDGTLWRCRRDPRVTRPIADIGSRTTAGVSYLRAEIQLLYKAKGLRPKDELDFAAALPMLSAGQRDWLRDVIALAGGPDHPWLCDLGPIEQDAT